MLQNSILLHEYDSVIEGKSMQYIVMLILTMMLWGCDGGSVLGPESMRAKFPTIGSVFYYEGYEIDRFDSRIPGTTREFTSVVLSADTILFGKSDVYVIRTQYPDTSFIEYFAINDEFDILRRMTLGSSSVWVTVPITSLAETNDTIKTTIDLAPGKRGTLEYMYKHTYFGDQSFALDTVQVSGRKFRSTLKYQVVSSGQISNAGVDESIDHYLPSLGMLAHSIMHARYDERTGKWVNGYVIRLKKHTSQ